jgi:hypothetical protein
LPAGPVRVLDLSVTAPLAMSLPASPQWDALPESKRVDWWLRRIALGAALAAAAPRFAGALADHISLQAALGASAAALAVCAVARERGTDDPVDWGSASGSPTAPDLLCVAPALRALAYGVVDRLGRS